MVCSLVFRDHRKDWIGRGGAGQDGTAGGFRSPFSPPWVCECLEGELEILMIFAKKIMGAGRLSIGGWLQVARVGTSRLGLRL